MVKLVGCIPSILRSDEDEKNSTNYDIDYEYKFTSQKMYEIYVKRIPKIMRKRLR